MIVPSFQRLLRRILIRSQKHPKWIEFLSTRHSSSRDRRRLPRRRTLGLSLCGTERWFQANFSSRSDPFCLPQPTDAIHEESTLGYPGGAKNSGNSKTRPTAEQRETARPSPALDRVLFCRREPVEFQSIRAESREKSRGNRGNIQKTKNKQTANDPELHLCTPRFVSNNMTL